MLGATAICPSHKNKPSSAVSAPETLDDTTTDELVSAIDCPCWGSIYQHSLQDLLKQLLLEQNSLTTGTKPSNSNAAEQCRPRRDGRRLILYESCDFVALNKTPDLRMDGPYPATVHKLLLYLYPPPSLQQRFNVHRHSDENNSDDSIRIRESIAMRRDPKDQELLQHIQQHLHRHNHVPDPKQAVRPCHQLDYATSGLLWVARTPHAAKLATAAFEQRLVQKTYTAVVRGHVSIGPTSSETATKTIPVLTQKQVEEWLQQAEQTYRRKRAKRKPGTFQGFLPPSTLFMIYKDQRTKQQTCSPVNAERPQNTNKRRKFVSNDNSSSTTKLSPEEWNVVWKPVNDGLDEAALERIQHVKWNVLKTENAEAKACFDQASDLHNQMLRSKLASANKVDNTVPTIFRVEEEVNKQDSFYIAAPVGQTPDAFAMRVPWFLRDLVATLDADIECGGADLDYKPCMTRCTVLEHAYYGENKELPVTKVRLEPKTGRRHQLRVHMVLAGHVILGDQTYSSKQVSESERLRAECTRMCLHSHKLSVGLPDQTLELEAPDPFLVDPQTKEIKIEVL